MIQKKRKEVCLMQLSSKFTSNDYGRRTEIIKEASQYLG
jgi:hypothetical protein